MCVLLATHGVCAAGDSRSVCCWGLTVCMLLGKSCVLQSLKPPLVTTTPSWLGWPGAPASTLVFSQQLGLHWTIRPVWHVLKTLIAFEYNQQP